MPLAPGHNFDSVMNIDENESSLINDFEDDDLYSDLDDESLALIDELYSQAQNTQGLHAKSVVENAPLRVTDIEDYEPPRGIRVPKAPGLEAAHPAGPQDPVLREGDAPLRYEGVELRRPYPEDAENADSAAEPVSRDARATPAQTAAETPAAPTEPDRRSPLEKFRRPPKKALSVTDLVSPAWCELQYLYTLTHHGRKRRTPAMKQGSVVHQALEDEVHVTVPVTVAKKEDSWGLRIWNVVQGLRTLRDTGRTRELEVWGTIGGELVVGIVDEVSYTCPDPELERKSAEVLGGRSGEPVFEYQESIEGYLVSTRKNKINGVSIEEALSEQPKPPPPPPQSEGGRHKDRPQQLQLHQQPRVIDERRIYITDVKTRGASSLPSGSAIRPTIVQLHLYHHMLENLAQGNFSLHTLTDRYGLRPHETFSDEFIAQIGGLNDGHHDAWSLGLESSSSSAPPPSTQDSLDVLLLHNTLASLWEFMLSQFRLTFSLPLPPLEPQSHEPEQPQGSQLSTRDIPPPSTTPTRLSPLLTARYVSNTASRSEDGVLGSKSFVFNAPFLKRYLEESLQWWRGEREAQGVHVTEAWKCRVCEFRDGCEWIAERGSAGTWRRTREGEGDVEMTKSRV